MYNNVTLVCINSKYIHQSLGIYYLKAYSKRDDIKIYESNINVDTDKIVNDILRDNPDLIGFSCYIFNIEKTLEVCKKIKLKSNATIFFGGPEASFEYENLFDYCDQIIVGAGESAFVSLLNGNTDKVIYGTRIDNPLERSPYTDEYFCNAKGKIAYFEASRGCPYACTYCMSSNDKLQLFDINLVKQELLKFKDKGIKILKFVDRTFNAKAEYCNEILSFLIDNFTDSDLTFHFEVAPDIFKQSTLDIIKRARLGLFQFEAGIQTFNDEVLSNIRRKSNVIKAVENIKTLLSFQNCHVHSDLIIGLTGEDESSLRNSFNTLYRLWTNQMQVGILKVLKGSRLKIEQSDGYVFSQKPPYEIISTPTMDEKVIMRGKKIAYLVDKYYNTNRFHFTLRYLEKKYEPWETFTYLAKVVDYKAGVFELYEKLFEYAVKMGEDELLVNELLKFDYLVSNKSKNLPPIIKREFSKEFKKNAKTEQKDGEFCYYFSINPITLEKGEYVAYFNYNKQNYITELYEYRILDYTLLKENYERRG